MKERTRGSVEPVCPFCKSVLKRPAAITISSGEQALGGTCGGCGAWYLFDPTAKNVGEIMMQALELAAAKLSKDASELILGEDYDDAVLSYDWRTHRSSGEAREYMDRYGRLYVLKVKEKT